MIRVINSSLFIFIFISCVFSQSALKDWFVDLKGENSGHTTCDFLSLPVSAQQLASGYGSFIGSMDATDIPLFPANTALSNRNKFAITHLEWVMGLRKEYAGALFPIPDIGTIGVFAQIFTPGEFTQARDIDENVSHPDMLEFAGGFSLSSSLFQKKINLGMSAAYIESRIDDASGRAVSFSSNVLFIPIPKLMLQLNCAQLGTSVRYTHSREKLPAQAGLSFKLTPLPDYLPFTSTVNFDVGAGIKKIADEPLIAGINSDILLLDNFHVLTSYDYTYGKPLTIEGFSVGAGVQVGMYGFDFSWKNQSRDLGSVWATTLKLQLNEKQPRTAEDYYVAAVRFFNRRNYSLSTFYAKKALQLDPSMWKAHSLLLKIKSQYLRNKNLEIGLFYTGNIRGAFTIPFDPSVNGGIARIAALLKSLQNQFPVFFSIESGNFIPKSANPSRIKCASEIIRSTGFDALCCGSEEYAIGPIDKASGEKNYELILSSNPDIRGYLKSKIIESNDYRLYIASYIGTSLVPNDQNNSNQTINENNLLTADTSQCNLRILTIDDTWSNIRSLAAKFQSFDIIICNNSSQQFQTPVKIGNVTILSPGKNGEYAGYCSIRFNESRKLISLENHIIPVNAEITPDPAVDSLVKQLTTRLEYSDKGIDSVNLTRSTSDGSFLFVSNRDSVPGIFLKDLKQHAEFPLTRGISTMCDLPVMTFKTELIAFRSRSGNDSCSKLLLMNLPGISRRTVEEKISINDMVFSPDGKWLFYSASTCSATSYNIYKVRYDGGKPVPVIDWKESSESNISVSPDNTTISFCSNRDGSSQIYICGIDGAKPVRISDSAVDYTSPSYSPSGNYLAYLSTEGNYYSNKDLWVYDKIKGVHRQITSRSNIQNYCWLNDGVTIVYSSGINIYDLNKVNIEQYRFNRLISVDSLKTWSDVSPKTLFCEGIEKIIFTREYADTLKKVMMVNTDGSDLKRMSSSTGSDWLP
jgi:Tol biopolymer transport system component